MARRKYEVAAFDLGTFLQEWEGMPWSCRKLLLESKVRSAFLFGVELRVEETSNLKGWMMKMEAR